MLTKITMPIVFFKRFKTMRRGSFMEIGVEWNKVEFNGHRRHFLCSSIHPLTLQHPTKHNKHPLILNLIQDETKVSYMNLNPKAKSMDRSGLTHRKIDEGEMEGEKLWKVMQRETGLGCWIGI